MIEFVKPTEQLIKTIAQDMRKSDAVEAMASHGYTPVQALMHCFKHSDYSTIIATGDMPLTMFGLSILNITTGTGCPWMLSSNQVFNHLEDLLIKVTIVISEMISICPHLVNHVHCENKTSINWLKSLGFTIEKPAPYGVKGKMFHRFYMEVM